jgi:hypothetical protein
MASKFDIAENQAKLNVRSVISKAFVNASKIDKINKIDKISNFSKNNTNNIDPDIHDDLNADDAFSDSEITSIVQNDNSDFEEYNDKNMMTEEAIALRKAMTSMSVSPTPTPASTDDEKSFIESNAHSIHKDMYKTIKRIQNVRKFARGRRSHKTFNIEKIEIKQATFGQSDPNLATAAVSADVIEENKQLKSIIAENHQSILMLSRTMESLSTSMRQLEKSVKTPNKHKRAGSAGATSRRSSAKSSKNSGKNSDMAVWDRLYINGTEKLRDRRKQSNVQFADEYQKFSSSRSLNIL